MKRLIQTIRNIWKIDDLRIRIINTLGFILIYRIGSFVVIPGVNPLFLGGLEKQTKDGVLDYWIYFPVELS